MNIIVQKFGGSSVADTDKLWQVCKHIEREKNNGNFVVVVVSAQGQTTNRLIGEEAKITSCPSLKKHDFLVSVGEQITAAKLSMCLQELGLKSVPYTGWQVPIITDNKFGDASIKYIGKTNILKELKNGNIVIVTGFQGIDEENNITTLGRGGSDTTAVALTAALNASRCDIYTDVDGVYSADPNIESNAIKYEKISYDDMLILANNGTKVLHTKCVELGRKYHIPIWVKSTFKQQQTGTLVTDI